MKEEEEEGEGPTCPRCLPQPGKWQHPDVTGACVQPLGVKSTADAPALRPFRIQHPTQNLAPSSNLKASSPEGGVPRLEGLLTAEREKAHFWVRQANGEGAGAASFQGRKESLAQCLGSFPFLETATKTTTGCLPFTA